MTLAFCLEFDALSNGFGLKGKGCVLQKPLSDWFLFSKSLFFHYVNRTYLITLLVFYFIFYFGMSRHNRAANDLNLRACRIDAAISTGGLSRKQMRRINAVIICLIVKCICQELPIWIAKRFNKLRTISRS
jgi:hypothetical protein